MKGREEEEEEEELPETSRSWREAGEKLEGGDFNEIGEMPKRGIQSESSQNPVPLVFSPAFYNI